MAAQLRAVAGLERDWVALPSELIGGLWGVSVAFEEGLPRWAAGRLHADRSLKFEAEIVLAPKGQDPERVLGYLLAAWLAMKAGNLAGPKIHLRFSEMREPEKAGPQVQTLLQAADWLVMSPQRLLDELRRIGAGGLEERAALIAMDLSLPHDLVLRSTKVLYEGLLKAGFRI